MPRYYPIPERPHEVRLPCCPTCGHNGDWHDENGCKLSWCLECKTPLSSMLTEFGPERAEIILLTRELGLKVNFPVTDNGEIADIYKRNEAWFTGRLEEVIKRLRDERNN